MGRGVSLLSHMDDKDLDPLLRAAPAGRAVFFEDLVNTGPFHGAYAASQAAARAITGAWGEEAAAFRHEVLHLAPPAMPTALRARFRPGEDREALTTPAKAAAALLPDLLG